MIQSIAYSAEQPGPKLLVLGAVAMSMPRWRGNVRVVLDRYAPYSIYRLQVGSGFLMAFSALR